jgi:hypothetical protein
MEMEDKLEEAARERRKNSLLNSNWMLASAVASYCFIFKP